ncbi:OmpH family outer membrane protein [uncultured Veillonella sp.]|uniref:OmpH family outer membrane protein n=1 Tax=uncultured Veillonella sp. TaxID=159268 RepID=UPI00261C704F|nr:OmpH family outer membrane protein [uncultured Veillonella sp.]
MNKKAKRVLAGLALMLSVTVLAGCGSQEKVGYINQHRILTETQKGVDIGNKIQQKEAEVINRLQEAQASQDEATFGQTQMQAQQEMQVFQRALASDFQNSIQASAAAIAKEKELTLVTKEGVVVGNGIDITDAVIEKMGKAKPNEAPANAGADANANANTQEGNSQPAQAQQ